MKLPAYKHFVLFQGSPLLNTLKSFNVFNEISDYLINIATKDVATDEIQESLLKAEYKGEICMK